MRRDLTTESLGLAGRPGRIVFRARGSMTVAGIEIAAAMLARRAATATLATRSGGTVAAGAELLSGTGDAAGLHQAWKASQTLVEALSGIASAARAIVDAAATVDPDVRVACTRKRSREAAGSAISQ